MKTTRTRVYETLARWETEGWPGLADRPRAPHHPARKVDLRAMAAIRRLQANPGLGEFRIHAALEQLGIHLSPLETVEWHPAQRLAPYRPRRTRRGEGWEALLLPLEPDAAAG